MISPLTPLSQYWNWLFLLYFQFSTLTINFSWFLNILDIIRQDCMCCSQLCLPWYHLHRAGGTLTARQGRSLAPSYPWLAFEALLAAEEQQQESGFPDPIPWAEGECWLRCGRNAYVLQDQHRVRCGPWPGAVRAGFPVSVVVDLEAMSAYTGKSDKPRSSKFIHLKCVKLLLSMVHCSSSDDSQVSLSSLSWCAMFHWRKRRDLSKFTNNNNPSPNFVFKIPLFLFYNLCLFFCAMHWHYRFLFRR